MIPVRENSEVVIIYPDSWRYTNDIHTPSTSLPDSLRRFASTEAREQGCHLQSGFVCLHIYMHYNYIYILIYLLLISTYIYLHMCIFVFCGLLLGINPTAYRLFGSVVSGMCMLGKLAVRDP
jgi:hypothetical protein